MRQKLTCKCTVLFFVCMLHMNAPCNAVNIDCDWCSWCHICDWMNWIEIVKNKEYCTTPNEISAESIMWWNEDVMLPARSPDLSACDCCLWRYLPSKIYDACSTGIGAEFIYLVPCITVWGDFSDHFWTFFLNVLNAAITVTGNKQ